MIACANAAITSIRVNTFQRANIAEPEVSALTSKTPAPTAKAASAAVDCIPGVEQRSPVELCRNFLRGKCKRKKCKFRHTLPSGTQSALDRIAALNATLPIACRITDPRIRLKQFMAAASQTAQSSTKKAKKSNRSKKSKPECKWAYAGLYCEYGDRCIFRHPEKPIRRPIVHPAAAAGPKVTIPPAEAPAAAAPAHFQTPVRFEAPKVNNLDAHHAGAVRARYVEVPVFVDRPTQQFHNMNIPAQPLQYYPSRAYGDWARGNPYRQF